MVFGLIGIGCAPIPLKPASLYMLVSSLSIGIAWRSIGQYSRGGLAGPYLIPIAIESGPTKCSMRVSRKPSSRIQPMQSPPA